MWSVASWAQHSVSIDAAFNASFRADYSPHMYSTYAVLTFLQCSCLLLSQKPFPLIITLGCFWFVWVVNYFKAHCHYQVTERLTDLLSCANSGAVGYPWKQHKANIYLHFFVWCVAEKNRGTKHSGVLCVRVSDKAVRELNFFSPPHPLTNVLCQSRWWQR